MHQRAIEKARSKLARSIAIHGEMERSPSLADVRIAWPDFLINANGVFSALEQGAKDSEPSKRWFGGVSKFRRSDPLLQYLHQARNSEEHSLEEQTYPIPGSLLVVGTGNGPHEATLNSNPDGSLRITYDPRKAKVLNYKPQLVFTQVSNRGVQYPAPESHRGVKLFQISPQKAAALVILYLEEIIQEAEQLSAGN